MRNEANLPTVVAGLGRDLVIAERRAATALLAWSRTKSAQDLEWLRSSIERRRAIDAQIRRNLSALTRGQGGDYTLRLDRRIRWDAREAYVDAMGLKPEPVESEVAA